jgi:TM2 domain-containing membrane protein YozV
LVLSADIKRKVKEKLMEIRVNKYFFFVVSFVTGVLGFDRFIRGQIGLGILKLLTFGAAGVWYLVDMIITCTKVGKYENDFEFVDGIWKK